MMDLNCILDYSQTKVSAFSGLFRFNQVPSVDGKLVKTLYPVLFFLVIKFHVLLKIFQHPWLPCVHVLLFMAILIVALIAASFK